MGNYPLRGVTDSTRILDLDGSIMTINVSDNTTLDITAGSITFIDNFTDPESTITKTINTLAQTGVTPTGSGGASFVTYKIVAGKAELNFNDTAVSGEQLRDEVFVGVVTHPGGVINAIDEITLVSGNTGVAWADWTRASLGVTLQESGRGNKLLTRDDLELSKSGGIFFSANFEARDNIKSPNLVDTDVLPFGSPIFQAWTTTDGSGTGLTLGTDIFVPGLYDDGTAVQADGAPVGVLGENEWAIFRVWYLLAFNLLTMQYGKVKYGNSNAARQAINSEGFDNVGVYNGSTPIGTIIARGGATRLDDDSHGFAIQGSRLGSHV